MRIGDLILGDGGASGVAASCAALAGAAPADADSTPAGDFSFRFSSPQPNVSAGLELRQLYKRPDDPNAKPSPVRRFLFAAPEGTVFDGSAVPACAATDQEFQQLGRAACPPGSVVGEGFITVMTGMPGEQPFALDTTVFNGGDGIIELFTEQGTGVFLSIERPKFRGPNAFEDPEIASTPGGPPDFQSAAREAFIEFPASRGSDGAVHHHAPRAARPRGAGRRNSSGPTRTATATPTSTPCGVPPRRTVPAIPQRGSDADDGPNGLPATGAGDSIRGRGGDDRLRGRHGADCLYGETGADHLQGNRDEDELRGGPGPDHLRGGRDADWLSGGQSNDLIAAVDGERDRVTCGPGMRDVVRADTFDRVEPNCERVRIRQVGAIHPAPF